MQVLSHASAKQKTKRLKGFRLCTLIAWIKKNTLIGQYKTCIGRFVVVFMFCIVLLKYMLFSTICAVISGMQADLCLIYFGSPLSCYTRIKIL